MTAILDGPPALMGCAQPRLWTRPLRELTRETTLGFEAIEFAETVLKVDLLPWQRWWLLHALELDPDGSGRFRFSTILTLVSRQNGKTVLLKIVSLWFLYMRRGHLVLGAAQALNIARESWEGAVLLAESVPELRDEIVAVRRTNGEQCLTVADHRRYMITAANRSAGRGLSVDLLILDELREQRSTEAWAALGNTTMARPNALTVGISNQGDDQSVVLNGLRDAAIADADPRLALFEWSAPDGCELDDRQAWAQANPGLGITVTESKLATMHATTEPSVFRTENLCQRVDQLDAAIDPGAWARCADPQGSLAPVRDRVVGCLDVAPDGRHVTLALAAQLDDGAIRAEIAGAWESTDAARTALAAMLPKLNLRALGWYPGGPAVVLAPNLAAHHGVTVGRWDVTKTELQDYGPGVVELRGHDVPGACQSLADLAHGRRLRHPADPLLDAHVAGASRLTVADGWRFQRRGVGHVDAAYAAAGAVHLARQLPMPVAPARPRVF